MIEDSRRLIDDMDMNLTPTTNWIASGVFGRLNLAHRAHGHRVCAPLEFSMPAICIVKRCTLSSPERMGCAHWRKFTGSRSNGSCRGNRQWRLSSTRPTAQHRSTADSSFPVARRRPSMRPTAGSKCYGSQSDVEKQTRVVVELS